MISSISNAEQNQEPRAHNIMQRQLSSPVQLPPMSANHQHQPDEDYCDPHGIDLIPEDKDILENELGDYSPVAKNSSDVTIRNDNHDNHPHDNDRTTQQQRRPSVTERVTSPYPMRAGSFPESASMILEHQNNNQEMVAPIMSSASQPPSDFATGGIGIRAISAAGTNQNNKLFSKKQWNQNVMKGDLPINASGTNLNVFLRGDRRHSLSPTMNELLTSPKYKSIDSGTSGSASNKGSPRGNLKSNSSSTSIPKATATSASDKKRLVDQFYNANVKPSTSSSRGSSSLDLSSMFRNANNDMALLPVTGESKLRYQASGDTSSEMTENSSNETESTMSGKLNDESFVNILNEGGFKFNYDSSRLMQDEELMNYLLNIDTMLDSNPEDSLKPFEQLGSIMSGISEKILIKSTLEITNPDNNNKIGTSLDELEGLLNYLDNLKSQTQQLMTHLIENRTSISKKYQNEINENINRMSQVSAQLEGLENKLNLIKDKITEQKAVISHEMMERLDLLERVNRQMQVYSKESSSRKFMQVNITIAVFILVFGIYYGYSKG